jgi:diguanylate cyclase (GGDEF)-like protein
MRDRIWKWYVAAGAIALAGYSFIPTVDEADLAYFAIGMSAVVAILAGVSLLHPVRRAPWYLMAAGQLSWVIGDSVSSWYQNIEADGVFPSLADVFYVAAYPLLAFSLVVMIRGRRTDRDVAGLLDSAILTSALALLSWVLLAGPALLASAESPGAAAVGLAYPVGDIVLAGLLIILLTTPGGRTPAFRFLLGAISLLVVGDSASGVVSLLNYTTSSNFALFWLAAYLAWGAAALHPSMRTLSEPSATIVKPPGRGRLAALTVATLVAPGTLAVELALGSPVDGWAIVVGSVVSFLLVVARMKVGNNQLVATIKQREQLQEDLSYQAAHDSLTRLPNRAQALHLIDAALSRAQRSGAIIGLLFVDLDRFKAVNDTYGHPAGDQVLTTAAARMQSEVRAGDVVARLGGDEFVVLLEPVDSQASVVEIAERLVAAVSMPMVLQSGHQVAVGASVGVAISMDGSIDGDRLLGEADAAVYGAKRAGRGQVGIYDEWLRRELSDRAELEAAITHGLQAGEFAVYYQPIVGVATGQVQGYEALIRWNRPGVGVVEPDAFIPTTEASKLICDLDTWVLREALKQLAAWPDEQRSVAVNISGRHMASSRILEDVRAALQESGVAADRLILEITETIMIDDTVTIGHLRQLRDMGIIVSIDDFGTGYNSIAQLRHLPVDIIKIDKSFLSATLPGSDQLFRLIVETVHACGLVVVAEGVETEEQLSLVRSAGCESAQGFLLARPMPASSVSGTLATRSGAVTSTAKGR